MAKLAELVFSIVTFCTHHNYRLLMTEWAQHSQLMWIEICNYSWFHFTWKTHGPTRKFMIYVGHRLQCKLAYLTNHTFPAKGSKWSAIMLVWCAAFGVKGHCVGTSAMVYKFSKPNLKSADMAIWPWALHIQTYTVDCTLLRTPMAHAVAGNLWLIR